MEEKLKIQIDGDPDLGEIGEILDDALWENLFGVKHNVEIKGTPGTGKTEIIQAWAKVRNVKLVAFDVADYILWEKEINKGNIDWFKQDISERLSGLGKEQFVLCLENYHYLPKIVEDTVLGQVIDHKKIYDDTVPNSMKKLDNMWFTVAVKTTNL